MVPPRTSTDAVGVSLSELTARLRRNSRRVTAPREALLRVLRQQRRPMTVKELHGALADRDCDLATVYRSLRVLAETRIVKRCDFGDGAARFELIEADGHGHHHHLVCTRCADIVELDHCRLPNLDRTIGAAHGFKQVEHRLEFFGLCPGCQG
jgi:Fur family ferric uptake transcriptional regulator